METFGSTMNHARFYNICVKCFFAIVLICRATTKGMFKSNITEFAYL